MGKLIHILPKIYQIKIVLKNHSPSIWRRVLAPSNLLLADLHKVIQTSMGWHNCHLHQFVQNGNYYSQRRPGDDSWDFDLEIIDYDQKKIRVSDLLPFEKSKMVYEYDFGDNWAHDIILEKILPVQRDKTYPVCTAGKRNCPPEDCGGVWGYEDLLEILKQPQHEEYESTLEWLGGDFDPDEFDRELVNQLLAEPDYGCFSFY